MSGARRVLVVAGLPLALHAVRQVLEAEGLQVLTASDGLAGVERTREALPDLIVIDASAPGVDSDECVTALRLVTDAPVLVLLPRLSSPDVVRLLDLGADDCATTPLPAPELLARARALLRRAEAPPLLPRTTVVIDERLTLDIAQARAIVDGRPLDLRPTEYRLLSHLVSNPGRLLPYESLLARVWGPEYQQEIQYVRLYVAYLRQKIEPDPAHPRYILTERGLGYRFVDYRGKQ